MALRPTVDHDHSLDLLTPVESAKALRVPSVRTLERWRADGTGPAFVKVGRRVAYRRADLHAYLAGRVKRST